MRCFEHEDREAVGICRACNRALCRACSATGAGGLSCHGECERRTAAVDELLAATPTSLAIMRANRSSGIVVGFLFAAMGCVAVASWLADEAPGGVAVLGTLSVALGLWMVARTFRIRAAGRPAATR